jgi:hypothetical protein
MADKRFPDGAWQDIVAIIASSFSMDAARSARLRNSATARLVAAIPFIAGCREPRRTALGHVALLLLAGSEAGRAAFDHNPGDDYDILARLSTGSHFVSGDPALIDRGMKLLGLI